MTELPTNPTTFFSRLAQDFRNPFAFAVFVLLLAVVGWLGYDHVSRSEFEGLRSQISTQLQGLQYTIQHANLDNRLNAVQDKIFETAHRISEQKSPDPQVLNLYNERMDELKRQEVQINHDMSLLEAQLKYK